MTTETTRPSGRSAEDYFTLIKLICAPTFSDIELKQKQETFAHHMEKHGDFYCAFREAFDIPQNSTKRLLITVDWKDAEGLDWQLDNIADTWGFNRDSFPRFQDGDFLEKRLLNLEMWLRPQGLSFVEWDTGGDEYIGWIMQTNQLYKLSKITPETMRLIFKESYIANQKVDLSPEKTGKNVTFTSTIFSNCEFSHTNMNPFSLVDCQFVNCRFNFRGDGRGFAFKKVEFESSSIHFKNAHHYFFDHDHKFEGCAFSGDLRDSRLCNSPYRAEYKGVFRDCDFQDLDIHEVEFRGMTFSEQQGLKFKGWPVITMNYGTNLEMGDIDPATFPAFFRHHNQYERKREAYQSGFYIYNLAKVLEDPETFWAVAFDAPFLHFPEKGNKAAPKPADTLRLRSINKQASQINKKYDSAFWQYLDLGFTIETARRDGEDLLLEIHVKYLKEVDGPGTKHLRLEKCTLCEFRGGSEDGDLLQRKKPFSVVRRQIDENSDIVMLIGARKAHSKLYLSFASCAEEAPQ